MKGIKWFFFSICASLLFICQSSFALPFNVTPVGVLPTTVDDVSEVTAYYRVTNTTTQAAPASFVKFLPPFVKQIVDNSQPTFCGALFNLAPNASCILALNVSGPVNPLDRNPEHHLFVCRAGGKTCAGTAFELNVTQVTLVSIAVAPITASVPVGVTQQYAATGTFSDGSVRPLLTNNVVWASSNTSVATINASTGLATGVSVGSTFITASLGSITSPATAATLTVTSAALKSISITPLTASLPKGTTLQYTAIGTYTDGSMHDITQCASGCVTWISSNQTVATISSGSSGGLATAVSNSGSTTITATLNSITSNSATLTATAAVLESITVTPNPANVAIGSEIQFTATGSFSDGSSQDITTLVGTHWVSSNTSVATIGDNVMCPGSNCKGTATGVSAGTTNITASSGSIVSQSVPLTVSAALLSIAVTPNPMVIYVGESFQFTATGTYTSGPSADITNSVGWSSSNPGAATINGTGLATGVAAGTGNIIAASGSVAGSSALTVNNQILYAGLVDTNVCTSSDGGSTWGNCVSPSAQVVTGMASAVGTIYAATANQVCSAPNNTTWTCPVGANFPSIPAIAALDLQFVYVVSNSSNQFVFVSSDDGTTFTGAQVFSGTTDLLTSIAVTDVTHLYTGLQSGTVFKSVDNGSSWPNSVPTGLSTLTSLAVDRATGHVYAGGNLSTLVGSVCKSIDASLSYTCSSTFTGRAMSVAAAGGFVYAGTNANTVCVSTDDAASFNCVTLPGGPANVTSLTIDKYGSVFAGTGDGRVCRSFDHGTTWPVSLCQIVDSSSPVTGLALTQG